VRVLREQRPAEGPARPIVDHRPHERRAEARTARRARNVDVGEIGERHTVGDRPREADGRAVAVVSRHQPPRVVELCLEVGPAAAAAPVGLGREELPHRVAVDPCRVVVDLEPADRDDHPASIALSTSVDTLAAST
jgi:hypothetical protein